MSATESQLAKPNPRRRWVQYRLRTLLFVVTAASAWLAWQACRAQQRAFAVDALQELRADTTSEVRDPEWFWRLFGERIGRTTTRVELDSDETEAAIPHLKSLPELKEVVVVVWPWDIKGGDEAESLLHEEMPDVTTQCHFPTVGWVAVNETVHAHDGASVLLQGLRRLKKQHSLPFEILIPEEE